MMKRYMKTIGLAVLVASAFAVAAQSRISFNRIAFNSSTLGGAGAVEEVVAVRLPSGETLSR